MFTINHLLLILFLVTVNPQTISSSYELIINKKCNQDGRSIITDIFDCQTAAEKLGFKDDQNKPPEAFERSFSDEPPGCYWSPDQKILSYNTKTSSTRTCSSKKKCICLAAPDCTHTNGLVANNVSCFCGNSGCTNATGFRCYKSINTCSEVLPCTHTVGTVINKNSCLCGVETCQNTTDSGLFCSNNNTLATSVSSVSSLAATSTSTSGCRSYRTCSITDGSIPNNQACACNANDCTTKTGLICHSESSTCSGNSDCGASINNNCMKFNPRCQCVQCKPTFFSNDCSETCPGPNISIVRDVFCVAAAVWFFLAYLYYTHRHLQERVQSDTIKKSWTMQERIRTKKTTKEDDKPANLKKARQKLKAIRRILISRMQIIASLLTTITWSDNMPLIFVKCLKFVTSFFTVYIPGLLTITDCLPFNPNGRGMSPISQWYLSIVSPFGVMFIFIIWYFGLRRLKNNSVVLNAVRDSGIQVVFVWLFFTIVNGSLTIWDCTKGLLFGRLLIDPSAECPVKEQFIGFFILFLYIIVPYTWFFINRPTIFCFDCLASKDNVGDQLKSKRNREKTLEKTTKKFTHGKNVQKKGVLFSWMFGWALEDYKTKTKHNTNIEGWELWNVFTRVVILTGSATMYAEYRFITHMIIMSWSFLLHWQISPYLHQETNSISILFCVCDLIGAACAYVSVPAKELPIVSVSFQAAFLVSVVATLCVVGKYLNRAMHEQINENTIENKNENETDQEEGVLIDKNSNNNHYDMFASYTDLEKYFLFPVLVIVWVFLKLYYFHKNSNNCKRGNNETSKTTKIKPNYQGSRSMSGARLMARGDSITEYVQPNKLKMSRTASTRRVARNTLEEAEISANIQKNHLLKQQDAASRRLTERLSRRNDGGTSSSNLSANVAKRKLRKQVTVQAVSFVKSSNHVVDETITKEAVAIREKSEMSRRKSMIEQQKKKEKADSNLQKRLALRKRAKQTRVLQKCAPFKSLTEQAQNKIVDTMLYKQINQGIELCVQGDVADCMYVLMTGHCSVVIKTERVATLNELDVFGESALFEKGERTATVTAETEIQVLLLTREDLNQLMSSGDMDKKCVDALNALAKKRTVMNLEKVDDDSTP